MEKDISYVLLINRAERLKKPGAEIVVRNDLNQAQDSFVVQAHLLESMHIGRAAGVGAAGYFDSDIGDTPFTDTEAGLGVIIFDLFCEELITSRSTEGFQVGGRSVDTAIKG
jgi:hypothetical protein